MKKAILMSFAILTFAAISQANADVTRCGWITEKPPGTTLFDATGAFIISTTGPGMFQDYSHGLIQAPVERIEWTQDGMAAKTFCGCIEMEQLTDRNFRFPIANVSKFTPKNLSACLNDANLPSLNQILKN